MNAAPTTPQQTTASPVRAPGESALREIWGARGVTVGLLAVGVGGSGEALLFTESTRGAGAAMLLLAMVLAVIAWGGLDDAPEGVRHGTRLITLNRALALRLAGIAGSLFLAWGSLLAWQADPGAVFGLQGWLWFASIALLVASCARWYPATTAEREVGQPWTRLETALFCALVGLTLFTFLYHLDDIPWRFHYDEAIAYEEAMRFYRGPAISLFTTTWYSTGLPSLWFSISGALMHLGGTGLGSVRLGVALAGALTVIPLYGLARLVGGRTTAVIAVFFWAVTPVVVHYSRISITNMTTPFAWAVYLYFLLRGLRSRRPGDFAWAGLAAGFSMYTYYGTRLLPYILLAFAVYMALFHFRTFREQAGHFALAVVGFVVGFGPLLAYFLRNPDMWAGRGLSQMTVPAELPLSWDALAADWRVLAPLADLNVLSLSVIPSNDRCYFAPFLSPPQAVLVLLGVGVLIWRWRQPSAFLMLLCGASVLFVGGTLVSKVFTPAFNHWTPAFPVFCIAMALPPALLLNSLRETLPQWYRPGVGAAVAGLLTLAAANAYNYLIVYPKEVPASFESAQGRLLASLGPQERVRFVGNSWLSYYPTIGEMVAPRVEASDFLNPSRQLDGNTGKDLVFVFNTDQTVYLPVIQELYPEGKVGELYTPGGSVGTTYRALAGPSKDTQSGSGLAVAISSGGETLTRRVDPFVGASVWGMPGGATMRGMVPPPEARDPEFTPIGPTVLKHYQARWEGEVYAEGGEYTMELRTDARARLYIDDRLALDLCGNVADPQGVYQRGGYPWASALLDLAPGWHSVRLDLDTTGDANGLEWAWTRPDGVREIVPPSRLRHDAGRRPDAPPEIMCGTK